jgi:hypothetical protein
MADLGTITDIYEPTPASPFPLYPISDYRIERGFPLGVLTVSDNRAFQPEPVAPLAVYVVRQIRFLFRQLWPSHGQRFPQ